MSAEDLKAGQPARSALIPDGRRSVSPDAICEYLGNMSRKDAEARALWLTQEAMRRAEA